MGRSDSFWASYQDFTYQPQDQNAVQRNLLPGPPPGFGFIHESNFTATSSTPISDDNSPLDDMYGILKSLDLSECLDMTCDQKETPTPQDNSLNVTIEQASRQLPLDSHLSLALNPESNFQRHYHTKGPQSTDTKLREILPTNSRNMQRAGNHPNDDGESNRVSFEIKAIMSQIPTYCHGSNGRYHAMMSPLPMKNKATDVLHKMIVAAPVSCSPSPCASLYAKGARNYVTYTLHPAQAMHREATFFIAFKQYCGTILSSDFNIQVCSSRGDFLAVRTGKDRKKPNIRIICAFWPEFPDTYEITVMLKDVQKEIDGSPFPIEVSPATKFPVETSSMTSVICPYTFKRSFMLLKYKLWGVVYDQATNQVYAADRQGGEILVFSIYEAELNLVHSWGWPMTLPPNDTFQPTDIALDSVNKRLYVTDKGNHMIMVYSLTGDYIHHFGQLGHQNGDFSYPWGIAVSPDGKYLAIADSRNHRIQILTTTGEFVRKYSIFETNPYDFRKQFDQPRGVVFDSTGTRLFVTDFNVGTTFELDFELTSHRNFGLAGLTLRPQGITMNRENGNFLICDSRRNLIRCLSPTGDLIRTFGEELGGVEPILEMPVYACNCNGALVIVDLAGMRIRLIN